MAKNPIPIFSPARNLPKTKYKPPRVPAAAMLGKAGRKLWGEIQKEYGITDPGGIAHLLSACRSEDDIIRLRAIVAKDGDTVEGRHGKTAHPLLLAIRGSEQVKRQSLSALNLDIEPLRDHPGRPRGK